MSRVAVLKCNQDFGFNLGNGIDLVRGFEGLFSPILIKPNICTISDNTGYSVTNVEIVENLIDALLNHDSSLEIKIVESDSQSKNADDAFEKFGYTRLADIRKSKGFNVKVVNLSKSEQTRYNFDGLYFKNPDLPIELIQDSYYISVAVPKTHYLTYITGTLKNQFGLLPRKDQGVYHPDIDNIIVDLNSIIKPRLCIFDARVGVERWNGPKTHRLDLLVVGNNVVATDAVMARIMGFEPQEIKHIIKSCDAGLGTLNPEVLGENPHLVSIKFKSPQ